MAVLFPGGVADGDARGVADGDPGGVADSDARRAAHGGPGGATADGDTGGPAADGDTGGPAADGDTGGAADGDTGGAADAGFGAGMDPESTYENEQDDDSYLRNPAPENEHVGTDEANLYEPLDMVLFSDKEKDKDYVADHESGEEVDDESEEDETEIEEEEEEEHYEANHAPNVEYDKEDPPMTEGSTYPNMEEFKLALSQHAVKNGFEYNTEKSTPCRFRGYCKRKEDDCCPWRIHASTTDDKCTVVVRKNPCVHDCSSAKLKKKAQNATKFWICEKVKDWLIEDATLGAAELRTKLKEHYGIKIHYKRVYMGKLLALNQLYGDWDNSFDNLFRFKAQVESSCPGSIVQIDHHSINGKVIFKRIFVDLKGGKHLCPICKEYGHHWPKCKKGNPEDIAAMMLIREPPKKRRKKTAETSIVPAEDGEPTRMNFPPSQNLETTTKNKGKRVSTGSAASNSKRLENTTTKKGKGDNSGSVGSKRSRTGSNKKEEKSADKISMVPLDSPAMSTRSKKWQPSSPAMSTRSKRRLSL